MDVIVSHSCADFDSLAAMVAASKIYPGAVIVFTGPPDQHVREFMGLHKEWIHTLLMQEIDLTAVKRLIVVDTREISRLGEFRNVVNQPGVELHVYDHHPTSYKDLVGDVNIIQEYGSTTTVLVEHIKKRQVKITPLEATLFTLGIYIDTGCLTYPTTTVTDIKCVAWLLEYGASLSLVSAHIHETITHEQRQLLTSLINSSVYHHLHGFDILFATAKIPKFVDELSLLTHKLLDIEQVDAVFSIVSMKDRLYIVGRSTTPGIDVNEILTYFGGGGHASASVASLRSTNVEEYTNKLWDVICRKVRPLVTAREVMSFPIHSVLPKTSISEVQRTLLKFGHSGILVMEGGRLVGTISRRDLDKAIHHGFGHAPVSAYMSRNLIVATPDTPLTDIQRLMVEHDIGRIPILEKGDVVGIVTRTDIIRTLGGGGLRKPILSSLLRVEDFHLLPHFAREFLHDVGEVGDAINMFVFVAGGFVRDLLLGEPNLDIDIVVEGDGIIFAKELASRKGGRVRSHEKFRTAVVIFPDGFKVDIATARSEFYARPAALPEVVGTSIKQDLARRDFSINAMAIKLNPSDFGTIIDFFSGQRDLQHGIIRILHNLSFMEDPTRIFRAIRFEQRYNFRMEQTTERLLKEAMNSGIFNKLSFERVRDELILILSEENPIPALKRMGKLKILPILHPNLRISNKMIAILEEIYHSRLFFKEIIKKESAEFWVVYLLGLCFELNVQDLNEMVNKMKFASLYRDLLQYNKNELLLLRRRFGNATPILQSQIAILLDNHLLEMVLFLYALATNATSKERIANYLKNGRKIKLFLNGRDILNLGVAASIKVKELLLEIKGAQLDGRIANKEEAVKLAMNLINK